MRKDHNILEDIKEEEKMRRQMKRRAHSRIRRTYHRAAALITVIPFIALPASMIAYAGNFFLTYFGLIEGERGFLHFFLASSLTVMVWASLSNIFESAAGGSLRRRDILRTWPILVTMLVISALLASSFRLYAAGLETASILIWLGIANAVPNGEQRER